MTDLKPCPFCGKRSIIIHSGDGIGKTYKVPYIYFPSCCDKHCLGYNTRKYFKSKEEAISEWNKREG